MMGFYERINTPRLLAAHRGYRAIRPENTLSAFEAAVGRFDFVELDLQLSKDGKWIICHDESLERTTDVELRFPEGLRPRRVADYSLSELRSLDAGSWFAERDPFGTIADGVVDREELERLPIQRLPTLEEVLDFARRHAMPLNLEIKDLSTRQDEAVVRSLLTALGDLSVMPPLLFSSFNHRYLYWIRRLSPILPTAALIEGALLPDPLTYLRKLGVEALHLDENLADEAPVGKLARHGIRCAAYTVNNPRRAEELYERGFAALFADKPLPGSGEPGA
ncbi:glycerophosphodiester phosphodiesterase [Nitratifractor sp.]